MIMTTLPLNTNIELYNGSCFITTTPLDVCVDADIVGQQARFLISKSLVKEYGLLESLSFDFFYGNYNEDRDILEALLNGLAQLKGSTDE